LLNTFQAGSVLLCLDHHPCSSAVNTEHKPVVFFVDRLSKLLMHGRNFPPSYQRKEWISSFFLLCTMHLQRCPSSLTKLNIYFWATEQIFFADTISAYLHIKFSKSTGPAFHLTQCSKQRSQGQQHPRGSQQQQEEVQNSLGKMF